MKVRELSVPGAWEITPQVHTDSRGLFFEWFADSAFTEFAGHRLDLRQANCSVSSAGVLRGVHFAQLPPSQAKYVTCLSGSVFDVVVDARPRSPAYRAWYGFELRAGEPFLVYVPEGCAHGYLTLEDDTEVAYQTSAAYAPEAEAGIHYADPAIGIEWPAPVTVVSERDRAWPFLDGSAS